jgi:hypothetical protein
MIYFISLHSIKVILVNEWNTSSVPMQSDLTSHVHVHIDVVLSYFYLIDFVEAHM